MVVAAYEHVSLAIDVVSEKPQCCAVDSSFAAQHGLNRFFLGRIFLGTCEVCNEAFFWPENLIAAQSQAFCVGQGVCCPEGGLSEIVAELGGGKGNFQEDDGFTSTA